MLPFQIAEAYRRARRRHAQPVRRAAGPSMSALLVAEAAHLGRVYVTSPGGMVALLGVVSAVGVHVALGPAYPGPVAPDVGRWLVVGAAVTAVVLMMRGRHTPG